MLSAVESPARALRSRCGGRAPVDKRGAPALAVLMVLSRSIRNICGTDTDAHKRGNRAGMTWHFTGHFCQTSQAFPARAVALDAAK